MTSFTSLWRSFADLYAARHEPENVRPLAEGFWRTALLCTALLIVCVLVFGTWEFVRVLDALNGPVAAPSSKPPTALDRQKMTRVLEGIQARSSAFEDVRSRPSSATDPAR